MDQPVVHFYTGIFHSQFVSEKSVDRKGWKHSDIRLEQRFLLKVEREISVEEFQGAVNNRVSEESRQWQSSFHPGYHHEVKALRPHVLLTDNHPVELEFADGSAAREICSELYVEYDDASVPDGFRSGDFTAFKDGQYHGRITGRGYARIPVLTEEQRERQFQVIAGREGRSRRGCLAPFLPARSSVGIRLGTSGLMGAGRRGCGRTGCGLLSLLSLLALLFSLWRGCHQGGSGTGGQRVIHDTIYVDEQSKQSVIKQFLDTTTIFKTESVELPNVQFYTNSSKLLPYSISSIQQLADYLNAHPHLHAVIEGHTDNTGDASANLKLSQQRAETVRQVLLTFGVEPERVESRGYGPNRPRADNSTVEGRALNRRVEVRLTNTEHAETKSTEVTDE
ncbi:MAG: hypothetical protein RL021_315 [Bacteroidota bacterium]